jgi:hypothetical protein
VSTLRRRWKRLRRSDGKRKSWLTPTLVDGANEGIGGHHETLTSEDAAEAYVRWHNTATIFLCVTEHGPTEEQLCEDGCRGAQIPPDRIFMTPADSLVTPFEFGPC